MLTISDLQEWNTDYFTQKRNIKKSEQACSRYDRLLMKRIRSQMMTSKEEINVDAIAADDPGKCLEKTKYEIISCVDYNDKIGCIRVNLLDRTSEFIEG